MKKFKPSRKPIIILIVCSILFLILFPYVRPAKLLILSDIKNYSRTASEAGSNFEEEVTLHIINKNDVLFTYDLLKCAKFKRLIILHEVPPDYVPFAFSIAGIHFKYSMKTVRGKIIVTYRNKQYIVDLNEKDKNKLLSHFGFNPEDH